MTSLEVRSVIVVVLAVVAAAGDWLTDREAGLGVVVAFGLLLGLVLNLLLKSGQQSDRPEAAHSGTAAVERGEQDVTSWAFRWRGPQRLASRARLPS